MLSLRSVACFGVASKQVQKQTRLCITRDLTEKDVVSRIMRKENYLIGLLNKARPYFRPSDPGMDGATCAQGQEVASALIQPSGAFNRDASGAAFNKLSRNVA